MARWARDLKNIEDAYDYFSRLGANEQFIWQVGDTRYELRIVDNPPNKYIVDSFSVNDRDRKVRHVLDENLTHVEVRYILPEHVTEPKCKVCEGQQIVWCYSRKTDVCTDCGHEE